MLQTLTRYTTVLRISRMRIRRRKIQTVFGQDKYYYDVSTLFTRRADRQCVFLFPQETYSVYSNLFFFFCLINYSLLFSCPVVYTFHTRIPSTLLYRRSSISFLKSKSRDLQLRVIQYVGSCGPPFMLDKTPFQLTIKYI